MNFKVLNYGSLNIDFVYRVPWLVKPGETLSAKSMKTFAGGKGANQSVALARAGAHVWHAGKIGEDGFWLKEKLKDNHVHTEHVKKSQLPNGQAFIQVDDLGKNAIIVYSGANQDIQKTEIAKTLKCFRANDYLLLQNEINNVNLLIEEGYKKGLKVCFNPSPITKDVLSYSLDKVSILIVNEVEGAQLTEKESYDEIIKSLSARYPLMEIVLTVGSNGAYYQCGKEFFHVPAQMVEAIDTTAAGDTFTGYYLASRIQGQEPKIAVEWAVKASSLCVQRHGAMDSIPTKDMVDTSSK